ncbi:hypothetical protein K2X05_03015 [bacterium]|nr:hypothetical protein [bacterium]
MKFLTTFFCFAFCISALAELEYHSERIKTMDIEVLQQIIYKNIKKLEDKDESPEILIKNSLQIVLAQPDQSIGISAIFDQLRTSSGSDKKFAAALSSITDDALASIKNKGKDKDLQRSQNTYVYILNNMLGELQKLKEIAQYKAIIEHIRDADIRFSDHLIAHRLLNSMAEAESPSKFAATIIPGKKPWWKFW